MEKKMSDPHPCEKQTICWLISAFPFISYLWIRIRIHGPKSIRIRQEADPYHYHNQNILPEYQESPAWKRTASALHIQTKQARWPGWRP